METKCVVPIFRELPIYVPNGVPVSSSLKVLSLSDLYFLCLYLYMYVIIVCACLCVLLMAFLLYNEHSISTTNSYISCHPGNGGVCPEVIFLVFAVGLN